MEKVYISNAGPEVSAAIYGFWRWNSTAQVTTKKLEDIVHYNLELGVNTFDHSNQHADGKVEELFGKALKNGSIRREEIVISTKSGIRQYTNGKGHYYDLSSDYLQASVHASLRRLQTDYIDIFLLEQFDPLTPPEETASALTQLLNSGKIRAIGVSNFNVFQHRLLASYLFQPIITNHIQLNLLETSAIHDGRLDFIKEQYSKPMAFAPLAGGRILNGTDKKAIALRNVLTTVGEKHQLNVEQTAVAWLYKLGALPIIGSTDKKRIRNAASAFTAELSNEDWYRIYQASL